MITSKILITTRPQVPQESPTKTKREPIRKSFSAVSIYKGFKAMCFELVYKRFKTHVPDPSLPISQFPLSRKVNQDNFKSVSHLKSLQVPVPRAYGMVKWIQSLLQESKNHKNFTPEKKEIHKNKSKRNPKTQDPR